MKKLFYVRPRTIVWYLKYVYDYWEAECAMDDMFQTLQPQISQLYEGFKSVTQNDFINWVVNVKPTTEKQLKQFIQIYPQIPKTSYDTFVDYINKITWN